MASCCQRKRCSLQSHKLILLACTINGQYTLQPHISKALNEFPDKLTSVKQIQQFLGLVNYMVDFIPYIVKYRGPLSQLLKKNPPLWD